MKRESLVTKYLNQFFYLHLDFHRFPDDPWKYNLFQYTIGFGHFALHLCQMFVTKTVAF